MPLLSMCFPQGFLASAFPTVSYCHIKWSSQPAKPPRLWHSWTRFIFSMWPLHQEHTQHISTSLLGFKTHVLFVVPSGRKGIFSIKTFFPPPWQALPVCAHCQHALLADVDSPCTRGSISLGSAWYSLAVCETGGKLTSTGPPISTPTTSYLKGQSSCLNNQLQTQREEKQQVIQDDLRLCLPRSAHGFWWCYCWWKTWKKSSARE